ncbi:DUF4239 domain-containing protein [Lutimonas zeaxanthinifaciens]|uniref:bestrophin-like domain n=1 Tax=Lutimonas zeaxanthinifaciens TaxID=3060215 RepID=UPI00265C97D9|nr:DUF4239 domain-containing protein [Lutimonas sp. YSD2104]WKK66284.1 DUF4239 domain-containing protein [Lutimonas sp. YSD2104]
MEILLELPFLMGLLISILTISIAGILMVFLSKRFIVKKITKQHERIGRLLFRVSAGLIALLLSLSYANENVRYTKILDSMEEEASILANVSMRLSQFETAESKTALRKIMKYVDLTINDDWKKIESDPFFSEMIQSLVEANNIIANIPATNENQEIEKNIIFNDLNKIIKLTQVRVYSQRASTPQLVYILLLGLTFMWIFFAVYRIDFVSLLFLTLYNILIAVLIYFVFSMSNPFIGPLKVKADSFIILKTKGFDIYFNDK